jgi:hypothetical protein
MVRSVVNRVMWVGRATVFMVGLAVILALVFWVANVVLGVGGKPFLPGEPDRINTITQQIGSGGADQTLAVEPLARRRAPQGYAHVNVGGTTPTFDPTRSKGVNDVVTIQGSDARYCFDLTFKPNVAVGSPFINNNAVVATATPPDTLTRTAPRAIATPR